MRAVIGLYKIIGEVTDLVVTPPYPPSVISPFEDLNQISFAESQVIGLFIKKLKFYEESIKKKTVHLGKIQIFKNFDFFLEILIFF